MAKEFESLGIVVLLHFPLFSAKVVNSKNFCVWFLGPLQEKNTFFCFKPVLYRLWNLIKLTTFEQRRFNILIACSRCRILQRGEAQERKLSRRPRDLIPLPTPSSADGTG